MAKKKKEENLNPDQLNLFSKPKKKATKKPVTIKDPKKIAEILAAQQKVI